MDSLSLAPSKVMTCLAPGWCDYVSKTIALTHVSTVSFTVSWDCSRYSAATSAAADRTDVAVNKTVQLSVHTSADGTGYDSVPVFERYASCAHRSCRPTNGSTVAACTD